MDLLYGSMICLYPHHNSIPIPMRGSIKLKYFYASNPLSCGIFLNSLAFIVWTLKVIQRQQKKMWPLSQYKRGRERGVMALQLT